MDKNYKHQTTGQECNAAQFIAEMVSIRKAEVENVGRPAYTLWNTKKWKNYFKSQVTMAYKLLKKYSDKAIINALNTYKCRRVYSLRVAFLEPVIKQEQKKLDNINSREIKEKEYKDSTKSAPAKPFGKQGRFSRLRNLEDE